MLCRQSSGILVGRTVPPNPKATSNNNSHEQDHTQLSSAQLSNTCQIGRLFAVRCAVQVHLSHNLLGVHFVRAVRVMRTAVLGPGTANGYEETTNSSSNNKRPRTPQLPDNAPEY